MTDQPESELLRVTRQFRSALERQDAAAPKLTMDELKEIMEATMNEKTLHDYCRDAVISWMKLDMGEHVSYFHPDDLPEKVPYLKSGGKIPKVTIEWVDEQETIPI